MAEAEENKTNESKKGFKIYYEPDKLEMGTLTEIQREMVKKLFPVGDFGSYSITGKKLTIKKNIFEKTTYKENGEIEKRGKEVFDVWRYNINRNVNTGCYVLFNCVNNKKISEDNQYIDKPATEAKENVCLLVIESPHKDEYDENFNPIAPAQGKTGKNIENYFCEIINSSDESIKRVFCKKIKKKDNQNKQESYEVMQLIICNPVQFQASLYELHQSENSWDYSNFKDSIWRKLYNNDIGEERSFINRVNKTYKPKIIINACTYNVGKVVCTAIKNLQPKMKFLYLKASSHPSVWDLPVFEIVETCDKAKKSRSNM